MNKMEKLAREMLEICRSKCSPTDEVILPNGRTNHEVLVEACALLGDPPTAHTGLLDDANALIDACRALEAKAKQVTAGGGQEPEYVQGVRHGLRHALGILGLQA